MIWLPAVSYATVEPLTNCGERTDESKVQRLRACAGSWMSRTTTAGSPTTVPMTMLSAAGGEVTDADRRGGLPERRDHGQTRGIGQSFHQRGFIFCPAVADGG